MSSLAVLKSSVTFSGLPSGAFGRPALRRIGLGTQRFLDFVHPRRSLVGSPPFPCRLQHIAPIVPVVQRVKPEVRLLLGLLATFN